jgi:hypothetical protein
MQHCAVFVMAEFDPAMTPLSSVIASVAKQSSLAAVRRLDCFVAALLAMTADGSSRNHPLTFRVVLLRQQRRTK